MLVNPLYNKYGSFQPKLHLLKKCFKQERVEYIEMDRHEYTLDDEDRKVQEVIMNPDPSSTDVAVLRRSFSYSYQNLPFNEVIIQENEKLDYELQNSQSYLDAGESEIIHNLMKIAQVFASNSQYEEDMPYYPYVSSNQEHENSNDLQLIVHSASNSQHEKDMPYYPYVSNNQEHAYSNDMQIVVHSASNSQCEKDMTYYPYVSEYQEHESSNDLQMIVHPASNTQYEEDMSYYPYASRYLEHENSNNLQIVVHSASNSQCDEDVPHYPYVSSNQEHENSDDLLGKRMVLVNLLIGLYLYCLLGYAIWLFKSMNNNLKQSSKTSNGLNHPSINQSFCSLFSLFYVETRRR